MNTAWQTHRLNQNEVSLGDEIFRSFEKEAIDLGLDIQKLKFEFERIFEASLRPASTPYFKVKDTCRVDNQRILPTALWLQNQRQKSDPSWNFSNIASFIPAAGAASRYLMSINLLFEHLQTPSSAKVGDFILAEFALSPTIRALLPKTFSQLTLDEVEQLKHFFSTPKALLPALVSSNHESLSFLQIKLLEDHALKQLGPFIAVCPLDWEEKYHQDIAPLLKGLDKQTLFVPQDLALSTLRFQKNAHPLRDSEQKLSTVPSGHGALVHVFPKIKATFPKVDALFIRNIDNVVGASQESIVFTQHFLEFYQDILAGFKQIRSLMIKKDFQGASELSKRLWTPLALRSLQADERDYIAEIKEPQRTLWKFLFSLFQLPKSLFQDLGNSHDQRLIELYLRPFNILGQVPNTGKDIGGTCVLIDSPFGEVAMCMETPHFNDADKEEFLKNPKKATHFNPVYALAELVSEVQCYTPKNNPFWLLVEKNWYGKTAVYCETVLYELLGNTQFSNVLFIEVPRMIFNPHKTIADTIAKTKAYWHL